MTNKRTEMKICKHSGTDPGTQFNFVDLRRQLKVTGRVTVDRDIWYRAKKVISASLIPIKWTWMTFASCRKQEAFRVATTFHAYL